MVSVDFLTDVVVEAAAQAVRLAPDAVRLSKAGANEFSSALSTADIALQELIIGRLRQRYPGIPIVAEEDTAFSLDAPTRGQNEYFVVDPIDGSYFFLRRSRHYAIQVAFVCNDRYAAAAASLPALDISIAAPPWAADGQPRADTAPDRAAFCSPDSSTALLQRLTSAGYTPVLACGLLCMVAPLLWSDSIGVYPGRLSIRGKIGLALAIEGGACVVTKRNDHIKSVTVSHHLESVLIASSSTNVVVEPRLIFDS